MTATIQHKTADYIIANATIWTANNDFPFASAMAVKKNRILAIGSEKELKVYRGQKTTRIDLEGKFIAPGFIDSHLHLLMGGFNLSSVQLRNASTADDFAERIGNFASETETGTWITGGEWNHHNWNGTLPHRSWIDERTPYHPVFVSRLDGHMALANSKAMEKAGINKYTKEIHGGTIVRDPDGTPTGIFKDNAMRLITSAIPAPSSEQTDNALRAAMNFLASNGVTSAHAMWESSDEPGHIEAIKRAHDAQQMITRIYQTTPLPHSDLLKHTTDKEGHGDEWLKTGGMKYFVDGSLGSHTAAFLAPYSDREDDTGLLVCDEEELFRLIEKADRNDQQPVLHAIGDRAVHILLNVYERLTKKYGPKDRRCRVEHAQHITSEDIRRFGELNVIASVQPSQLIEDGVWTEQVIGTERLKTTHAYRQLLDSGALITAGSDWPVANPSPLLGIYSATTRRTIDGKNPDGWVPQQKISIEEALKAYTINAAYASFEENIKGSLEPGKLADFAILSENPLETDPSAIKDIEVLATYVDGKKVFERNN